MTQKKKRLKHWEKLETAFEALRFDSKFHSGLGDIRLTMALQEFLVEMLKDKP